MGMTANEAFRIGAVGIALTGTLYVASRFSGGASTDGRALVRGGGDASAAAPASAAPTKPAGAAIWERTFVASGAGGGARLAGVAATRAGEVLMAGSFTGAINLGGATLESAGEDDVFVAKLDREGKHVWSHRFGGPRDQKATGVAVTEDGEVVVAGTIDQRADFGGGVLQSAGMIDVFCLRLDANGGHLWSRRFGDDQEQEAGAVAVDREGNVLLAGSYEGKIDFGSGPIESAGHDDIFVAKLDRAGKELWSRRYGDAGQQKARAIAAARDGGVIVTGTFRGDLAIGKTTLASPDADALHVFALDASGAPRWARASKGAAASVLDPRGVTVDGDGAITVAASLRGSVELAGATIDDRGGEGAALLARFDASGAPAWATRLGEGRPIEVAGLAATREGDVVVVTSPLGVLEARPRGETDGVTVVRFDRKGHVSTTQRLGPEPAAALGVTLDPAGRVLLGGSSRTPIDVLAGPLAGLTAVVIELRR